MQPPFQDLQVKTDPDQRAIDVRFLLQNRSRETVRAGGGFCLGWQLYDADTSVFLGEGEWTALQQDLTPGGAGRFEIKVELPPEEGRYHVYISPRSEMDGWYYKRGWPFLLLEAGIEQGRLGRCDTRVASLPALRRAGQWSSLRKFLTLPWLTLWRHRGLVRSMARRDISSRYRGSFGDMLWTVLHPLLLMSTYFFVFGVVLQARFGNDPSRSAFALYFLAGLLPWLPFSEAVGRAPGVLQEHRNFVKKMLYPVETLPVHQALAALVTEAFALAVFLAILLVLRGKLPASAAWLPLVLIPQLMLTVGVGWFLAGLGVFVRDLGQVIGFLLTILFFLTPICYPEASLPSSAVTLLKQNPIYTLVKIYRAVLLEGAAPYAVWMVRIWGAGILAFLTGFWWFHKLRRSFPDVI